MKRIAVLFGGCSSEYRYPNSIWCNYKYRQTKYTPVLIGIDRNGKWFLFEERRNHCNDTWWKEGML